MRLDTIRVTVTGPGVVVTELAGQITHQDTKAAVKGWIGSLTPLEAQDIAAAVTCAVIQPLRVNVNEILIRSLEQAYWTA